MVFDCAIIVAALILARYGPANNSAAFKKILARFSQDKAAHFLRASNASDLSFHTVLLIALMSIDRLFLLYRAIH